MKSVTQRTLPFDFATLTVTIAALNPKRLRTLFRGLLLTAAHEPRVVTDIDGSGYVLMVASIQKIAIYSGVDARTIQRCRAAHADVVEHDGSTNERSHWCFSLAKIMPENAIQWFIDLVETTTLPPRQFENAAPAFCTTPPGILRQESPNATPAFSKRTSMCLVSLNTASLASLALICEKHGIAIEWKHESWSSLSLDQDGLRTALVVDGLYELASASATIQATTTNRNRIFTVAAIATRKVTPWQFFRSVIVNGWLISTITTSDDAEKGQKLRRQADELRKLQSGIVISSASTPTANLLYLPMTDEEKAASPTLKRFEERKKNMAMQTAASQKSAVASISSHEGSLQ